MRAARSRRHLPPASNEYDPLAELDEQQPNPNSVQLMQAIDALPKSWRALVYEYGFNIVNAMLADWPDIEDAEFQLMVWRERKQAEWLGTNFFLRRPDRRQRAY